MVICVSGVVQGQELGEELVTCGDMECCIARNDCLGNWNILTFSLITWGAVIDDDNILRHRNGFLGNTERISNVSQTLSIVTGKTYNISVDLDLNTNANISIFLGGVQSNSFLTGGEKSVLLIAGDENQDITFQSLTFGAISFNSIDDVSVKEVIQPPTILDVMIKTKKKETIFSIKVQCLPDNQACLDRVEWWIRLLN